MLNKITKICKTAGDIVVTVALLLVSIPVFLYWCFIGLGHGLISIINGTD